MSQQILEKLFDSPVKLRLLKLFLRNPEDKFSLADMRERTLLETLKIKKELQKLEDIKLVKSFKKRGVAGKLYFLNTKFLFIKELQNLILRSSPADEKKMKKKVKDLGKMKLVILSGIFLKSDRGNSRTDILLVCDNLNDRKLLNFIRNLQAEAGVELNYAVLTTEEFRYRQKMFDRFVLDILEKPHKKLVNKLL